ncbi:class I SAM-dependent methyltransferase [Streptomyces sp. NPDC002588]|uniref:class I SAM-dependent methyltransferase n=1 Tax=Streptomyces sp. NPDC002588 TaxID=3154419 RepID=UPI00331B2EBE
MNDAFAGSAAEALAMVDNHYYTGSHYDSRYATYTHDLDFWLELGRRHGPEVLELACGTGRISIPLARAGCRVTGIDIAPSMLGRAERKRGPGTANPRFLTADMRSFDLGRRFDLILLPCSSITHLLRATDAVRCLRSVRAHLKDTGHFVLDLLNPHPGRLDEADREWRDRFEYPDPVVNTGLVTVRGRRRYDADRRILVDELDYHFTATGRTDRVVRRSRMFPHDELTGLIEQAGLTVTGTAGGFRGEPFGPDADTQVLFCVPAPSGAGKGHAHIPEDEAR